MLSKLKPNSWHFVAFAFAMRMKPSYYYSVVFNAYVAVKECFVQKRKQSWKKGNAPNSELNAKG